MRHYIKYVLFHLLLFGSLFFYAQNNDYRVLKTIYSQEQGLPSAEVYCGTQDEKGFLWFGTRAGLCRFDGTSFVLIPNQTESKTLKIESLVNTGMQSIVVTYVDPKGSNLKRIRRVIDINSFKITVLSDNFKNLPFADTAIVAVYRTFNNELGFLVKAPNQLWCFNPAKGFYQNYTSNKMLGKLNLESYNVTHISEKKGHLVIGWRTWKSMIVTSETVHVTPGISYYTIAASNEGSLLYQFNDAKREICCSYKFDLSGNLTPFNIFESNDLVKNNVRVVSSVASTNDNTYLLELANAETIFADPEKGKFNLFEKGDIYSGQTIVNSYFKDNNGYYWLCSSKGLVKLRVSKKRFRNHFNNSTLFQVNNNSVRGIFSNENYFIANLFNTIAVQHDNDTQFIAKRNNYGLLFVDSGIWLGAFELRYHSFKTNVTKILGGSTCAEIWSIYPLNKNELLLGGTLWPVRYSISTNSFVTISNPSFPNPAFVYKFFKSYKNELFAVADNGIYLLSEKGEIIDYYGSESLKPTHKLPFTSLRDFYIDREGNYWIATNGQGLCKWDKEKNEVEYIGLTEGFLTNSIYCIQEDDFGNLWLSTEYGLAKYNKKSGFIKVYTEKDGISNNEFNRASQFKDSRGRIYFGGMNGVTSFKPSEFAADTAEVNFQMHISGCTVYNISRQALEDVTDRVIQDNKITISPNMAFCNLSFALLNYETGVRNYAYKIDGLDKEWNYITENKLRLSNLPYGNYKLLIKAKTAEGYWNNKQIELDLIIETPFYKKWWFILLLFLAALSVVGGVFYFRFKQRLNYLDKMNLLRVKLASDLHDEVGGLLNKSAMQSELAKSMVNDDTKPLLDKIAYNCRQAMSSMRDIMWNLDARNDSIENLLDRMREYAQNMLSERHDYELDIHDIENVQIVPEKRQALYLILKEAINNILKHSRAGKVKISLYQEGKFIHLTIFNESEFVKNEFSTGQGLKNMQMRAEKVKGTFTINLENGVEIRVKIPL